MPWTKASLEIELPRALRAPSETALERVSAPILRQVKGPLPRRLHTSPTCSWCPPRRTSNTCNLHNIPLRSKGRRSCRSFRTPTPCLRSPFLSLFDAYPARHPRVRIVTHEVCAFLRSRELVERPPSFTTSRLEATLAVEAKQCWEGEPFVCHACRTDLAPVYSLRPNCRVCHIPVVL
jgi:hypothetical protein